MTISVLTAVLADADDQPAAFMVHGGVWVC
jgi:hypothetical protein